MFLGHFAVGLAGKRASPRASLGTYFAASVFLDMLWPVFLLVGIERLTVVPGITAFSPFDFVYPWSHSLLAAVFWSLAFAGGHYLLRRDGTTARILAAVVFSHWVLDWVTHRPDLPLAPGLPLKTGLGLWNSVPGTLAVEFLLFFGCVYSYERATEPIDRTGRWAWLALIVALLAAYLSAAASNPLPGQERQIALGSFGIWLFIPWAVWVDRHRAPVMTMKRLLSLAVVLTLGAAALAADSVPVRVSTDMSGGSTRVVLSFAKKVGCAVSEDAGRIKIACDAALLLDPPTGNFDDVILQKFGADGERGLTLTTGRGYRSLDTFELKNPTRLVLDLQGVRTGGALPAAAPPGKSQPIIVLDPGHGGVETGAIGPSGLAEKDVTLDLARRLKVLLERQGATVVLTRDDDRVLPLDDRTAIANHNRAVLFLSIHMNASKRKTAVGAETYFLAVAATDAEARTLAGLENKAYEPADAAAPAAPEGQAGRDLELILWDLAQNSFLAESSRLAEKVQTELNTATGVRDRGVRQAPFRVLMGATMPAILVEAGFISNPEEEARFKGDAYKDKVVEAIARAVASITARP
jgi:N-acetylmuramoyl-L-alanine amidase